MTHRKGSFPDKYRALSLSLVLLLCGSVSFGQSEPFYSKLAGAAYYNWFGVDSAFWIPQDTIKPPVSKRVKPHVAYKNKVLYCWIPELQRFSPVGNIDSTILATRYWVQQNFIQNQFASAQSATAWMSGKFRVGSATNYFQYDPYIAQVKLLGDGGSLYFQPAAGGEMWIGVADVDNVGLFGALAGDAVIRGGFNKWLKFGNNGGTGSWTYGLYQNKFYFNRANLDTAATPGYYKLLINPTTGQVGYKADTASAVSVTTLTDAATVAWDISTQGKEARVTLAGNRALSIANLPASQVVYLTLAVTQDATGSRTLTLPAGTKVINGGAGAVTLTTTGGATDLLSFRWNGTTLFCTIGKNYN